MSDIAHELEVASEKFTLFGKEAEDKLSKALVSGMLKILAQAKKNAPKDTGILADSIIQTPIQKEEGKLTVVGGPTVAYGALVEYGSGPHVTSEGHDDFILSITRWGERKGMDQGEIEALIRHIRENGTKPHPYLGPAWYSLIGQVKADIEEAMK